jgi:hypothetical protein
LVGENSLAKNIRSQCFYHNRDWMLATFYSTFVEWIGCSEKMLGSSSGWIATCKNIWDEILPTVEWALERTMFNLATWFGN